ncbi:hypothetical protein RFI_32234 [Reticulomyxa filosa]|uniref:Uncharacterized protein n=1 Tax=Reticulomyxa filosa TaxID=46433 RepID=X6LVI1_RETFI|nr:hypothetical protein RFI_32234 [Reticulomyxa filosa]|eukprot:ETO05162.1 hypothetical protein RFI_32234 [Reticulomyxa filosa]
MYVDCMIKITSSLKVMKSVQELKKKMEYLMGMHLDRLMRIFTQYSQNLGTKIEDSTNIFAEKEYFKQQICTFFWKRKRKTINSKYILCALAYLLFGTDVGRNPDCILLHQVMLYLIKNDATTTFEVFFGKSIILFFKSVQVFWRFDQVVNTMYPPKGRQ